MYFTHSLDLDHWRIWWLLMPMAQPTIREERERSLSLYYIPSSLLVLYVIIPSMAPHSSTFAWCAAVYGVAQSQTRLSDFTFIFHFHALEKEMATHSSVLAWRIPRTVEPGGLPSMGSHRVGHDWSDAAAAAAFIHSFSKHLWKPKISRHCSWCEDLLGKKNLFLPPRTLE